MKFKYAIILLLVLFSIPFVSAADSADFKIIPEYGYDISNIEKGADFKFTIEIFNDSIELEDLVVSAGSTKENSFLLTPDEQGIFTFSNIQENFKIFVNLHPKYDLFLNIETNFGTFTKEVNINSFPFVIDSLKYSDFAGWSVSKESQDVIPDSTLTESDYLSLEGKTIYAVFIPVERFKVNYVGFSADPENKHVSVPVDNSEYEAKAHAGVKFDVIPEVYNSKFLGWARDPDTEFPDFVKPAGRFDVATVQVYNNTTLYGVWDPKVSIVTYDLDGGTGAQTPEEQIGVFKRYIQLPKLPRTANKDGAKHLGWLPNNIDRVYEPGAIFMIGNSSVHFTAVWGNPEYLEPIPTDKPNLPGENPTDEPNLPNSFVNITLNFENGKESSVYKVSKNGKLSLPPISNPGYFLKGWVDKSGELIEISGSNEVTVGEEDVAFFAKWEKLPTFEEEKDASILDVILLLQYISGTGPYAATSASEMINKGFDFNSDGKINMFDVILYLKSI